MILRSSLSTLFFVLPGAHFSCPLLELTQRDAEQIQALLLGDRLPEGLDPGHALPERLALVVSLQREWLLSSQHEATAALPCWGTTSSLTAAELTVVSCGLANL